MADTRAAASTASREIGALTAKEFALFRDLIYSLAGIALSEGKQVLVSGRLARRLKELGLSSYGEYYRLVTSGQHPEEQQRMVDQLTTNETYFFREPKHFDFLAKVAAEHGRRPFQVWSAASSSGEEAYTMAMVLAETLGLNAPWQILGSDISRQVLERAERGHYSLDRTDGIPPGLLRKYCLKGVRSQAGTFLIGRELREHVTFRPVNLIAPLPDIPSCDVIFLRNVMIYFDQETKRQVVANLTSRLKPGGHFIVGHSETLNGISETLKSVAPTIYRKP